MLENSPASEAGLLKNDQILKVNNKNAADLSITALGEMFERPGNYRITVRRGDKTDRGDADHAEVDLIAVYLTKVCSSGGRAINVEHDSVLR